jgi:tRNA(fMet)-specific endonuclease VapC
VQHLPFEPAPRWFSAEAVEQADELTVAELCYGAEKSTRPEQNLEALGRFLLPLEILAFGEEAAAAYGRVRAALEKDGTSIGVLDTLIAAHAVSVGVRLVEQ